MALRPRRGWRRRDHGHGPEEEDERESKQKDAHDRSRAPSHHSPLRRPRARHAVRFTYTLVQPEVHRIERPKSEGPGHAGPEKDFKEFGPSRLPRRMDWEAAVSGARAVR